MDEQRSDPGDFRCLQRARQRITKQGSSQPRLMVVFVDRQTAEHHHRDGIRPVAAQGARSIVMPQRSRRKAVVTDNGIAHADDVGARRTARSIASGAPFEPVIERRLAAFKRIDDVMVRKRLRRRYHLPASQGAGAFSNLRSRSVGAGGLSSEGALTQFTRNAQQRERLAAAADNADCRPRPRSRPGKASTVVAEAERRSAATRDDRDGEGH